MTLESFATDLLEEVLHSAEASEGGEFHENAFTREILEWLVDLGECVDPEVAFLKRPGLKLNGWDLREEGIVDLVVTIFDGQRPLHRIPRGEVLDAFSRGRRFLERALDGLYRELEESEEGFEAAQTINARAVEISRARIILLTNGITSPEAIPDEVVRKIPVTHHVWDVERLFQVSEGRGGPEPIQIGPEILSGGLACVALPTDNGVYQSYVGVFPGKVLADLYRRWGQRLLERNLRSYLLTRTKINRALIATLRTTPQMFFAFNNGISTTADAAEVEAGNGTAGVLRRMTNFQIVNGGQTTATLAEAARLGSSLESVFVQFKLTVIRDPAKVDENVPLIARYANSQNKVSLSDFSSNSPFHMALERLSRQTWVPNPDQRGKATTKWYYERVRAAYLNDIRSQPTPAQKRRFREEYPPRNKITKTELAKYVMTWRREPHTVSRGAEKNYLAYMELVETKKLAIPDESDFQRFVAMAILFRRCDDLAREARYQGFKANIVAYSVAYLSHGASDYVDLDAIWRHQSVDPAIEEVLKSIMIGMDARFRKLANEGINVSEWCKKEANWEETKFTAVGGITDLRATVRRCLSR